MAANTCSVGQANRTALPKELPDTVLVQHEGGPMGCMGMTSSMFLGIGWVMSSAQYHA